MASWIKELEKKINKQSKQLSSTMNTFMLAKDEMRRTFSSLFENSSNKNKKNITNDMDKFEKKWLKNLIS